MTKTKLQGIINKEYYRQLKELQRKYPLGFEEDWLDKVKLADKIYKEL